MKVYDQEGTSSIPNNCKLISMLKHQGFPRFSTFNMQDHLFIILMPLVDI